MKKFIYIFAAMMAMLAIACSACAQTVSQPGIIKVDIPEGLVWFSRQMHDVKELGLEEQGFDQETVDAIMQSVDGLQIFIFSPEPNFEIFIEFRVAATSDGIPQEIDRDWLKSVLPALQEQASALPGVQLEDDVKIASFPNTDFVVLKTKQNGTYTKQYMTLGNGGLYKISIQADTPITPDQEALLESLVVSSVFTVPANTEQASAALPVPATLGKGEWRFSLPDDWEDLSESFGGLNENMKLYGDSLGAVVFVSWEDRWPQMPDETKALYEEDPRKADIQGLDAVPLMFPQGAMPEDLLTDSVEVNGVSYGLMLWEKQGKFNEIPNENSPVYPYIECVTMVDGVYYGYHFSGAFDMPTLRGQMEDILKTVVYPAW